MNTDTLSDELECARFCAGRRPCWELGDVKPDHTWTLTLWNSSLIEVSFLQETQRWLVAKRYDDKEYDRYEFKPGELPHMLVEAMLDMELKPAAGRFAARRPRC